MLNAVENVVPKDGERIVNVCSRAMDEKAWRTKAPYPGAWYQKFATENWVSNTTEPRIATATASDFRG